MKFRIYLEPVDVEASSPKDAKQRIQYNEGWMFEVRKILPIDEDGFPIEQPKQVE